MTGTFRKIAIKTGASIVTLALTVSLFLFVFSIKPLASGIWFQSEAPIGMMHAMSGLCALGIGIWSIADRRILLLIHHPFVYIPLSIALWSVFASFFQPIPGLSFFGVAQVGEGIIWYMDLAVYIAAAIILQRFRALKLLILILAFISLSVICVLSWRYVHVSHALPVPLFFQDYIAFIGGALILLTLGFSNHRKNRNLLLFASLVAGGAAIYISDNNAAYGMAVVAVPVFWLFSSKYWNSGSHAQMAGAGLVVLTAVVVTILLFVPLPVELTSQNTFLGRAANSILSRTRLAEILLTAFSDEPLRLITGWGWGSYSTLLATYLPVEWAILRDSVKLSPELGSNWDAVLRVDFHSHNIFLEALSSAGILGAILSLCVFAMLPLCSRSKLRPLTTAMATYFAGVSAFWFIMPICLPFIGLAFGSLARPMEKKRRRVKSSRLWLVPIILGLALLYAGIESLAFSRYAFYYHPPMKAPLYVSGIRQTCTYPFVDSGRGGIHLAHRIRVLTNTVVSDLKKEKKVSAYKEAFLRGVFCAADEYLDQGTSFRLLTSSLLARADIAFAPNPGRLQPLVDGILSNWGERTQQALSIAPKRTDLAVSYLLWLLRENRKQEFSQLALNLFNNNPEAPVGLWFSGIALLSDPNQFDEGIKRMRFAIERGIERMMPIDENLKRQIYN